MGWQDDPIIQPAGKEAKAEWENDPVISAAPKGTLDGIKQGAGNLVAGAVRGAGSIGSTILAPYDMARDALAGKGLSLESNRQRRAGIDAGLQELGANPESGLYQVGKVAGEIAGTAGAGGVLAKGVGAVSQAPRAVQLANALRTGGFSTGAPTAATKLGRAADMGVRMAGGGVSGGAMTAMVAPEDVGTGAALGAALPGVARVAGEAGMALNRGGKAAARRLMQSAIKPTIKQLKTGDARVAVDTLLDYGASPNKRGVEKLRLSIDKINDDIASRIAGSKATVSRQKALDYLTDVRAKAGNQVSPAADVGAIQGVADDFMGHPNITRDAIPVQQAQELKKGTYQALRGQYGQVRGSAIEAQKAVARGLKEQIADVVPGIGPLNAEEARLLKTLDVAERRALMELNKNPVGLSALAGNPLGFAAFMADRSAAFKALAARSINRASALPSYAPGMADQLANPVLRGGLLSIAAD